MTFSFDAMLEPYIASKAEFGRCPRCGYRQICPCDSCATGGTGLPKRRTFKPWKWIDGELVQCASCGFTKHIDWWETWDMECAESRPSITDEEAVDPEVEKAWQDFWLPVVRNGDKISLAQIKRELFDFLTLVNNVPLVYDHVTGGKISKANTDAAVVTGYADENYRESFEEEIADELVECFPWLRARISQLKGEHNA